uniref:Transposase, MuDR, MULE transposase domain protein n=1 Tax=Tanacetum cinerariifolium TaxID=118510 RepID=A0A6L2ND17_TANCI|nr:hypothetical protein [Tanacetum cinerariifolium]
MNVLFLHLIKRRDEKKRLDHLKQDLRILVIKRFRKRKKVKTSSDRFRKRKLTAAQKEADRSVDLPVLLEITVDPWVENYKIKFKAADNVPTQGDAYGYCGVWVCIFLHQLCQKLSVSTDHAPDHVELTYREHMVDYLWKYSSVISLYYKNGSETFEVKDDDDLGFFVNEVYSKNDVVHQLLIKIKSHMLEVKPMVSCNDFDLNVSLFPTNEDFNRLISILSGYRPEGLKKLELAGFEKWSKAYCPANRYNYMSSNNVESVNSLSRIVRKPLVTRLIEYFRDLIQRWMDDPNITMEEYIRLEEENGQKCRKVFNWETANYAIVYNDALTSKSDSSTELIEIPHRIDEFDLKTKTSWSECDEKEQNILYFNDLFPFNIIHPDDLKSEKDNDDDKIDIKQSLRGNAINADVAQNDLQRVLPPLIVKPQAERPKNTDRILSRGKGPSLTGCSRFGIRGHNRNACNQPLLSQKEQLTSEALWDEERLRNGRIYPDWIDVVQPEPHSSHRRRSTNYSCLSQIDTKVIHVP